MNAVFKFEDIGKSPYGHIYRSVAKITLVSPSTNKMVNIWMIVDTGADYTILPRHFSEKLRISLEHDCFKDTACGIGGNQAIYFYKGKI